MEFLLYLFHISLFSLTTHLVCETIKKCILVNFLCWALRQNPIFYRKGLGICSYLIYHISL